MSVAACPANVFQAVFLVIAGTKIVFLGWPATSIRVRSEGKIFFDPAVTIDFRPNFLNLLNRARCQLNNCPLSLSNSHGISPIACM